MTKGVSKREEKRALDLAKGVPPLITLYAYVTGCCNLRCRHCWIDPIFQDNNKFLSWDKLRRITEDAKSLGLTSVKLTGGEPLLHPQFLEILFGLKDLGLRIIVETNGTLLGPKEAEVLKEVGAFVSVSIDAPMASLHDEFRGVKGAFDRTLKGASHLKHKKIPFQVITCLYRGNTHLMPRMVELAKELGAGSIKINPINDVGRGQEMARQGALLSVKEVLQIYEASKSWSQDGIKVIFDVPAAFRPLKSISSEGFGTCGILNILGILSDGEGALCGIGEHVKEMKFGSVVNMGVKNIWRKNKVLNLLRKELPHGLKGVCGNCIFRAYCLGKCRAWAFWETGDVLAPLSFCQTAYEEGFFPKSRLEHTGK